MNQYKIVHSMKINGKAVVVLDKNKMVEDMNKKYVVIDGAKFDFLLTNGDDSIIIESDEDLIGKTLHFE